MKMLFPLLSRHQYLLEVLLLVIIATHAILKCGPSLKPHPDSNSSSCVSLENRDVLRAINWLAHPPRTLCKKVTTVQDTAVCEDNLPQNCVIWSIISSNWCDHYGSLAFEKYWSERGCSVTIFHFVIGFKGNTCNLPEGQMKDYPNIIVKRQNMWARKCYNCFYATAQQLLSTTSTVHVLKVQIREGVNEDFDGVQFTILADLHLHLQQLTSTVQQIVFIAAFNTRTLTDFVGREAEHGWNVWAAQRFLREYAAFDSSPELGPPLIQPLQYSHMLRQAKLDPQFSFYRQSFMKLTDPGAIDRQTQVFDAWQPAAPQNQLKGVVPSYCREPSASEDLEMQQWIHGEINARCHPTRLWVVCDRSRGYDAFVPCPQELMNNLAEDYAATKGWCDFSLPGAEVKPLGNVDEGAYKAFKQSPVDRNSLPGVRLAFFFTVYTDAAFVSRLFQRLYGPTHYYMFHIDPTGATHEFEEAMRNMVSTYSNAFLSKDVPIVYGASTATILLTRSMKWFHQHATGWDYFVPLTGSDYPMIPLHRIERIFAHQQPPMPFVMAWTPGTSTHIFRLEKTHPVFELDPAIHRSITAVTDERGKVLGAVPMEFRSNNFGPPLFCENRSSFAHLDNRQNKSGRIMDTQWLFPRDTFRGRGRAYAEENPAFTTPSFDGVWRVWKKSDPATTGAYDWLSVDYIVNSVEGRKYWHFFKHMLLGSEEHYYVSLLYNWPRTKSFVQTLSAQVVWNTWELGLWEHSTGFMTHTHFLSLNEWDILEGFAKRGMMFARKFSSKKTAALLDRIDAAFLLNASTDAGLYWPGFFEVDITTPGKQWVAAYRRNQSARAKGKKAMKQVQVLGHRAKMKPGPVMRGF